MKKELLAGAVLLALAMMSTQAMAGDGEWFCPTDASGFFDLDRAGECIWAQSDVLTFRGKSGKKSFSELAKAEKARAEKEASKLTGKALTEAASKEAVAAYIAAIRARVFEEEVKEKKARENGIRFRAAPYSDTGCCAPRPPSPRPTRPIPVAGPPRG
ncbi:MAG: hypothetical protein D6694_09265 [Gammaproteobacteria bacterium]|nr:MAG: hypothetical protein D6694_09265 [Gammaproteobacteria bacterium]